ncbi:hypothetical protein ACHAXT_006220 [Thalassiosira profunda]
MDAGWQPPGGAGVGVGMLRGVRRPPPSRLRHGDDVGAAPRNADAEVDELLDELDSIELSPSDPGYRSELLAVVGLGDNDGIDDECDDDETDTHRWDRRKSGRRRNDDDGEVPESSDAEGGTYSDEDDEFEVDASEYESFNISGERENTRRASLAHSLIKLMWVTLAVAAVVYVFYGDERLEESEVDEDVAPKKNPYSYHGYKDARIPDDDAFGVTSAEDNEANNHDDFTQSDEQHVKQHEYHEPTGDVETDALWKQLDGYAEMAEPYDAESQLPVFWHIPKCGGTTLQDLMVHCIGMVGANEIGAAAAKDTESLAVVQLENGNRYANVDMTTPEGIAHAKEMGFGQSGLADVVMTPYFDEAASVFDNDHNKGRCFTMLRHPIRRAISLFWYLKDATWEHTYSEAYRNMTIVEFAKSHYAEDNWMVRFLTNQMTGGVYARHLDLAKEILESKCLVGILEEFKPSFERYIDYFGWDSRDFGGSVKMNDREKCILRVMDNPDNRHKHPKYAEGGEVWDLLMERNRLDVGLYEYALHLFHNVQSNLVNR